MIEREEVESLVREIEEGCRGHSCTPHDMSLDVEGDILLALCRAWLAVEDAPKVRVRGKVGEVCMVPVSHDFCGQRVRIVKEGE